MAKKSDYFGLSYVVSVILAIFVDLRRHHQNSGGQNRCGYPASVAWLEHYLDT